MLKLEVTPVGGLTVTTGVGTSNVTLDEVQTFVALAPGLMAQAGTVGHLMEHRNLVEAQVLTGTGELTTNLHLTDDEVPAAALRTE